MACNGAGAAVELDAKKDFDVAGKPPVAKIPTPSRGGRREGGQHDKTRGSATALEDIMRRKGVDEAWTALEDMQRQGVVTDKYTVSRMLMKTVGDGRSKFVPSRIYRGMSIVERFIEQQPKDVDEVLFNALLDTCCRLKDLTRLETIVAMMKKLQVTPSPVTLGILVKTYGQAGDLTKVLQVWEEMEQQKALANAVTYGCMIDACIKCGCLQKADDIFQAMRAEGKHKNTILYTTLIKGYGMEKDLPRALALFREMPVEGVPYNTITYNSMMDACVKCGDLASAEGLLREMTSGESSSEPDLISFSTILKGYCHTGDLDKALQVAESMKARGLRSDELVYNTLMDGCVKVGDVSAGLGLFEEMVQVGLKPSAITNSILLRLYQKAGYEDGASEAVVQLYQRHGLEKPVCGDRNTRRGQKGGPRHGQSSPTSSFGLQSPAVAQLGSPFGIDILRENLPPLPGGYSNGSFHSNNSSACCSPYGSPTNAPTFATSPVPPWHVPGDGMPHILSPPQGPSHFMHGQGQMMPGWPQMPPMQHPFQPPQPACFEGWGGAPNMAAQQQQFQMQQMRDCQQIPMWASNPCPSSGPAAGESIMLS
eukprot:TRINITY_DN2010_c0_g2_i2.p1 TRINITY_DN2010_c0_g2~~TRINITY_DN2010_c0_g2_i2.p1  ORF type:complete len:595 (-),score=125.32 TRINITY_DN2010_c0_g2_i2:175-1959(-)